MLCALSFASRFLQDGEHVRLGNTHLSSLVMESRRSIIDARFVCNVEVWFGSKGTELSKSRSIDYCESVSKVYAFAWSPST